jgi:hypothetical protein
MSNQIGVYEGHITVKIENVDSLGLLNTFCKDLGDNVKCLLIDLPIEENNHQLMTGSYHRGTFTEVFEQLNNLRDKLINSGFIVIRMKLEAMIGNQDVPASDLEAERTPNNYFEFHILVMLNSKEKLKSLVKFCNLNNLGLSRNALKKNKNGVDRCFVTLRMYNVGKVAAQEKFKSLVRNLKEEQFELKNFSQEYIVYDNNPDLDKDWIFNKIDHAELERNIMC